MASSGEIREFINMTPDSTPKGRAAIALAKHLNLEVTENLGVGSQGEAFLLSDGRVLKVTNDKSEYYVSTNLARKPYENINTIYKTYKFKYQGTFRFGIIQKFVSQEYREDLKYFEEEYGMHGTVQDLAHKDINLWEFKRIVKENIKYVKDSFTLTEEGKEKYLWFIEQYNLIGRSFHKMPQGGCDFFYRNSGYDAESNKIVAIDLGYSTSYTKREGEVLEL